MATRSIHDTHKFTQELVPQTLNDAASPTGLQTGDIDMQGFDSLMIGVQFGDIDEMGTSPVGIAHVAILVEHAPDDGTGSAGTYVAVADTDLDGVSITSTFVGTPQTDANEFTFGYLGKNRFVRVTLIPNGLPNGGPVAIASVKGHAHLTPVANV